MFFRDRKKIDAVVDKAIEMVGLKDAEHTDVARLSGGKGREQLLHGPWHLKLNLSFLMSR